MAYDKVWKDYSLIFYSKQKVRLTNNVVLTHRPTKTTILYSHGNAADIGAMFEFLILLRDYLPVNVFHYEYIGYGLAKMEGESPLTPNEHTTYESAEAAFEYLTQKKDIPKEEIIM
jgi:hypothetical protein